MTAMPKRSKNTESTTSLSEQLREAILDAEESRYRIAQATGITEATLSKFVNGHHGLSQQNIDVLGRYLGLELVSSKTNSH